jgi:hypothetical protein
MLKYLHARDSKIKLLYTLNVFRSIQKRLTIEMREMGTRDRVMGDCIFLGPMETYHNMSSMGVIGEKIGSSQGDKSSAMAESTHRSIVKTDHSAFHETNYSNLYKIDPEAGSPLNKGKTGSL